MTACRRWLAGCTSIWLATAFGVAAADAAAHRGAFAFERGAPRGVQSQSRSLSFPLQQHPSLERDGLRALEAAPSVVAPTPQPFANPLRRHRMAFNAALPRLGTSSF